MRSLLIAATTLMLFATGAAQAKVAITVDKDAQMMTVAVDGVERYHWPVSSGNPSHETPNGSFRTFRMEEDHYSKEFDDAPMPHSIFFTKVGHAIHGTESEGRLGTPVSHGCVRLSRANATTLYALVQEQGVLNTTVTLTGSSTVALARNPKSRTAVARRDPAQQE
jgi:lipoprotein-anchoring transpeptidase ErfK/SrfK